MPKQQGNVNYPTDFIIEVIAEWDAIRAAGPTTTHSEFATLKGIKVETFRTWLEKKEEWACEQARAIVEALKTPKANDAIEGLKSTEFFMESRITPNVVLWRD
ncbi:unnamed protein product [Aphanomyces euteiches]